MNNPLRLRSYRNLKKLPIKQPGLAKQGSCHTLRYSFAKYLLEDGYDVRIVQNVTEA